MTSITLSFLIVGVLAAGCVLIAVLIKEINDAR